MVHTSHPNNSKINDNPTPSQAASIDALTHNPIKRICSTHSPQYSSLKKNNGFNRPATRPTHAFKTKEEENKDKD
jgi:hypothetical protein